MENKNAIKSNRVISVDVLRGITIFLMLFANFGFLNSPWFMRHYEATAFAGVTYVDYIFSMFLILVGISMPLAFRKFEDTPRGRIKLIRHIFIRGGSLLFLGLIFINTPNIEKMGSFAFMNPLWEWMNMNTASSAISFWRLLTVSAVILLFNQIALDDYRVRRVSLLLRCLGAAFLIYYMIIFVPSTIMELAETQSAHSWLYRGLRCVFFNEGNWLRGGWWEILGLIGWAYIVAGLLYVAAKRYSELIYLALTFLVIFSAASTFGRYDGVPFLGAYAGMMGKNAILTMLGVGLGVMMMKNQGNSRNMFGVLSRFLFFCLLISLITTPLGGMEHGSSAAQLGAPYRFMFSLNKNWSSLGWIFTTGVICSVMWMVMYYICDIKKMNNFVVRFFSTLGSVPLTAYIFQFWVFAFLNVTGLLSFRWNSNVCNMWGSMAISVGVTIMICLITNLCKKWKFTLKL